TPARTGSAPARRRDTPGHASPGNGRGSSRPPAAPGPVLPRSTRKRTRTNPRLPPTPSAAVVRRGATPDAAPARPPPVPAGMPPSALRGRPAPGRRGGEATPPFPWPSAAVGRAPAAGAPPDAPPAGRAGEPAFRAPPAAPGAGGPAPQWSGSV